MSHEPCGIMFAANDPLLADAVRRAVDRMARDRDLVEADHRWFERPTPSGKVLNLPISLQLAEVFRVLGWRSGGAGAEC